jgi:hypothetical protein
MSIRDAVFHDAIICEVVIANFKLSYLKLFEKGEFLNTILLRSSGFYY